MSPNDAPDVRLMQLLTSPRLRKRLGEAAAAQFGKSDCDFSQLHRILEEEVLDRLSSPAPVSSGDFAWMLETSFTRPATGVPPYLRRTTMGPFIAEGRFDRTFDRFVRRVTERVLPRTFSLTPLVVTGNEELTELPLKDLTLWKNELGVRVAVWGAGLLNLRDPWKVALYASAEGFFAPIAARQFARQLSPLLQSLVRSWLAASESFLSFTPVPWLFQHQEITVEYLTPLMQFISDCLGIVYQAADNANTFNDRLRTAILLLVEADRQQHFAIALSLCFSALEAMLSRSTSEIVGTLSRSIATLLEPPGANRTAATKVVKDLYAIRSKVLHGASLSHEQHALADARLIAAAVLQALLERRAFMKRVAGSETADDFFAALEHAQLNGKTVDGVQESVARSLWEREL